MLGALIPESIKKIIYLWTAGLVPAVSLFAEHPVREALRQVYASEIIYRAKVRKTADTSAWRRLVHYDSFLGRTHSEARDKSPRSFFAAPGGISDPEAELTATVTALFTETSGPEPGRCRYPAREIYLVQALEIDPKQLPPVDCKAYADWLAHMDSESASIVFAGFFMGNPSSMFGHTFLRLHNRRGVSLIDSSFNYAANPTTENALLYAWLGMTGGFPGTFAMHPYYQKVNEYNDLESRDLWEYRLNLTPTEVRFMQAHLWELSNAWFPYYYLDENCSYQLLALLEVVRPETKLTSRFSVFVAPADTLRTLETAGFLAGDAAYRASLFTKLSQFYENLDTNEKERFAAWLADRAEPAIADKSDARVADTLLEFYRFRNEYNPQDWHPEDRAHYGLLLAARARFDDRGEHEKLVRLGPEDNPLHGVPTMQWWAGGIYANGQPGITLGFRPALRELQDTNAGYPLWSQIQLLSGSMAIYPGNNATDNLRLEELHFVDIMALAPWQARIRKPSYRLRTGIYNHYELDAADNRQRLSWDSLGAIGITLLPWRRFGFFLMAQSEVQVSGVWSDNARLTAGILGGFKAAWTAYTATVFFAEYARAFLSEKGDQIFLTVKQNFSLWKNGAIEADLRAAWFQEKISPRLSLYAKFYF